jgi:hypothetical protein
MPASNSPHPISVTSKGGDVISGQHNTQRVNPHFARRNTTIYL